MNAHSSLRRLSSLVTLATLATLGTLAGATALGCVAAPVDSDLGSSSAACSTPPGGSAPGVDDYAYFVAVRTWHGVRVAQPNGVRTQCADGRLADSCEATLDLAHINVSAADGEKILSQLGDDPRVATLLFVGKTELVRDAYGRKAVKLSVSEVWRAPEPRVLSGNVYHVSHEAKRALLVGTWNESDVAKLDFGHSPTMEDCDPVGGETVCVQTHAGVLEDAEAPAGLVVYGERFGNGTLRIRQYFIKIDVGQAHLPNGYWYCSADQAQCDNGDCYLDNRQCHVEHGHGRGQIYGRTGEPAIQPWFLGTTQLLAGDPTRPY